MFKQENHVIWKICFLVEKPFFDNPKGEGYDNWNYIIDLFDHIDNIIYVRYSYR